ncbi:hypothetical protein PPTG_19983 [Phytophthora nicotianae INRA-310]|uniref:Uncharacterized protein n=1 Tax=Phytophthora nicotianae (strain INRA-310) TaxID=761204 RepID=W2PC91_PHYN3|nr:hypothetical protein PPTG_19983 [Phytophthora nicotianae INRA-310]ETM97818.1 hypothetical protein PPTG_19983 [Phytophthora nicotianae INRA-310]
MFCCPVEPGSGASPQTHVTDKLEAVCQPSIGQAPAGSICSVHFEIRSLELTSVGSSCDSIHDAVVSTLERVFSPRARAAPVDNPWRGHHRQCCHATWRDCDADTQSPGLRWPPARQDRQTCDAHGAERQSRSTEPGGSIVGRRPS